VVVAFKGFEDAAVSSTDTGFAGDVKQDDDCGTTKAGKAPNKDDLKRIYLSTKTVNGDVFLMIGCVRIPQNSVSASAHVGYEFNQANTFSTLNARWPIWPIDARSLRVRGSPASRGGRRSH